MQHDTGYMQKLISSIVLLGNFFEKKVKNIAGTKTNKFVTWKPCHCDISPKFQSIYFRFVSSHPYFSFLRMVTSYLQTVQKTQHSKVAGQC